MPPAARGVSPRPTSHARPGQTSTSSDFCLTADQVTTLRRIHSGPTDEHGRLLYPGYQLRGSELNWAGIIAGPDLQGRQVHRGLLQKDGYETVGNWINGKWVVTKGKT
ncbi:hypothetical protein ACWY4P_48570 [Streptomyces sp. LZ34]